MSTLFFTKMQGLGNDFIVIDAFSQPLHLSPNQIRRLANRHFGIGADQILLVERSFAKEADFRYRIFNADGNEVEHCGNGARCFAKYVRDYKLTDKDIIPVEVNKSVTTMTCNTDGTITVKMGIPNFTPASLPFIPSSLKNRSEKNSTIWKINLSDLSYTRNNPTDEKRKEQFIDSIEFAIVSIGNPHAVISIENVEHIAVSSIAKTLEKTEHFPNGINIGFMQTINRHSIKLRVHERGVGETLACGTGACAAAVTGIQQGKLDSPVKISMPGGELSVAWKEDLAQPLPILMTGSATTVFTGQIDLDQL